MVGCEVLMNRFPLLLLALSAACVPAEPAIDDSGGLDGTVPDADEDGFRVEEGDCDDDDPSRNPGAVESCNGLDDDCDGTVDDGALGTWYDDADDDGYGDPASARQACDAHPGAVAYAGDCDDQDAAAFPGAEEVCDERDNDCDGVVDEGVTTRFYDDADADGFGDADLPVDACALPDDGALVAGDCDPTDGEVFPGSQELCDGVDNDCDGEADGEDALDTTPWFADADGDSFGDPADERWGCEPPQGYVMDDLDCDDADPGVHPGAWEYCSTAADDDCDGEANEASARDVATWYLDADVDGYGRDSFSLAACDQPSQMVALSTDCDDLDPLTFPGAEETCDGADNDCDGTTDERDADGDGAVDEACGGDDCDDGDASVSPAATEVCDDGTDQDCDGTSSGCGLDASMSMTDADAVAYGTGDTSYFGVDIAARGDLTGDGVDDVVVSAYYQDVGTYAQAGKVFVFDVPTSGVADPTLGDATITGTADDDAFGVTLATADYNVDGVYDLAVGAHYRDSNASNAGAVAIFAGGSTLAGPLDYDDATMVFEGEAASDYAGIRLAGVRRTSSSSSRQGYLLGAYNNDAGGSNAGAAYLVRPSSSSSGAYDLATTSLAVKFKGEDSDDRAGTLVAGADLDANGYDDMLVGAQKDDDGGTDAGAVYVIFDSSIASMDLADADAKYIGEDDYDYAGNARVFKGLRDGDLDGDGYEELVIPADSNDAGGADAGALYVLAGADVALATGVNDLAFADTRVTGETGDRVGQGILDACDVDGDRVPDLVVGTSYRSDGTGGFVVFYGPLSAGDMPVATADVQVGGAAIDEYAGVGGLCLGDVDGNGADDLAVGSYQEDVGSLTDAGAVRVFLGGWW